MINNRNRIRPTAVTPKGQRRHTHGHTHTHRQGRSSEAPPRLRSGPLSPPLLRRSGEPGAQSGSASGGSTLAALLTHEETESFACLPEWEAASTTRKATYMYLVAIRRETLIRAARACELAADEWEQVQSETARDFAQALAADYRRAATSLWDAMHAADTDDRPATYQA